MSETPLTSGVNANEIFPSIVALAPGLVERIDTSFAPMIKIRKDLRAKLLEDKEILSFDEKPAQQVESMCAIDGARVKEQMYISDLLVAVATTSNAKSAKNVGMEQMNSSWADVVRHVDGTDRLAETAMACQEVALAATAKHDVRILDGSFLTPIIGMREGLFIKNPAIRNKIADLLTGQWQAAANLLTLVKPTHGATIAIAKSDSASKYCELYKAKYEMDLDVADRFLASQVLSPGELLRPRKFSELAFTARIDEVEGSQHVVNAAAGLRESVNEISRLASTGHIYIAYFKPYGPEQSNAVIRFEYVVQDEDPSEAFLAEAIKYASIINAECSPPFMMEPFAQWAVDRMAKQISSGTSALRATLIKSMPPEQAALLAQNYRT